MNQRQPSLASLLRKHARAIVVSVALTAAFVFVMRAGALPVLPPRDSLSAVAWGPAGGFLIAMYASMLAKYARCYFLVAPVARVPMRRIMSISCIAMALITLLPLRLGEMARPALLRERGKLSGWALTATVAAERIIDGVAFGVLLLGGLALARPREPVPDHIGALPVPAALVPRAAVAATAVFGVSLVVMVVFYARRELARSVIERGVRVLSRRLAARLAGVVERSGDGLRFLADVNHAAPYLVVTAVSVLTNVWAFQLLAMAVRLPRLDFSQASVVLGVLAIGFALPNAPGFFGAIQLALYAGLAQYVAPDAVTREGAAFAFLYYVGYLGVVFSLALGAFLYEQALRGVEGEAQVERSG
jgi:hypothetical protein